MDHPEPEDAYCPYCDCVMDEEGCPDCDAFDEMNEEDEAWLASWAEDYDTYPPPRDEDV